MERPILKPIGTPVEELDTPSLVVDLDAVEANIEKVHSRVRQSGAKLRPYAETHRCPAIAHKQLAAEGSGGGIGVASVSEAEMFAQNGIGDILIVNQIVTAPKISRLCALARRASITVVADNPANVRALSAAAQSAGVALRVVIDINTGQERSGVSPGQPALELARVIVESAGLDFAGLMCADDADLALDAGDLAAQSRSQIQQTLGARDMLERGGIAVDMVCVSGSHCYELAAGTNGVTDILAGAYALMDLRHSAHLPELKIAAQVMASVSSLPEPGAAILDTGRKAMGDDYGFPIVAGRSDLEVASMSAEHGKLRWDDNAEVSLNLGDRVRFTPMDIGACVNVYDYIHAVRDGRLEAVYNISARGLYR